MTPLSDVLHLNGSKYQAYAPIPASNLHRVLGDFEVYQSGFRTRYPTPAVWFFADVTMGITMDWQLYLVAINHHMEPRYVSALLNSDKAICNKTGFHGDEERRNYILREGLDAGNKDPRFSKVYTFSAARHMMQADRVACMDGTKPPLLKPGAVYPERVEDVNIGDYLYSPQTHPHLFSACVNVDSKGNLFPFPNGATYSWFDSGRTPVTWLPLVATVPLVYPPPRWLTNNARLAKV